MSPTPQDEPVLVADDGTVRVLTLHRPAVRNAIDWALRVRLAQELEAADADPGVRAIVLTGSGSTFCSGGDIATMQPLAPERVEERARAAQRVVRAIWNTPKPVLAAVEGSAYGAGVALAVACDRVVTAADARFAATFTRVGLAGDMGAFVSLPARVGTARARQLLMMGTVLASEKALAIGLVDAVVAPGQALAGALADAAHLAAGPPLALGVVKRLLSDGPRHRDVILEQEIDSQVELWRSADFAEGVAAFREKRPPTFRGGPP